MKFRSCFLAFALAAASLATTAHADTLTDQITTTDTTQLGRPSRSGTNQTWTGQETYTGQINTATTYYYKTYIASASQFQGNQYIDISVFDETGNGDFFVSAFYNSYDRSNRGQNWLGDEGSSGNIQFFSGVPGDARDFQVILPVGDDLILLVNSTLGGTSGLNQPFDITVNAFSDNQFDDGIYAVNLVAQTPEPGSLLLTATGLLGACGVARRRFAARA